jgi:hypothetical protein
VSRSRHKTIRGVFGGKPATEIDAMIEGGDEDVEGLVEKKRFKREEQERRSLARCQPKDS